MVMCLVLAVLSSAHPVGLDVPCVETRAIMFWVFFDKKFSAHRSGLYLKFEIIECTFGRVGSKDSNYF